jgi:signal peptidase II
VQERRSLTALSDVVPPPGRSRSRRRSALIVAVAAVVVALDQATKTWALHHLRDGPHHVVWTLRLNLTFNTGIAFSEARGSTAVVTAVALVVVALLVLIARRTSGTLTAVILGLIIGGALGNLIDRLIRHHAGGVIDFIDFQWWPVFNVADAAITVGVVIAVVRSILGSAPSHRGASPGAG